MVLLIMNVFSYVKEFPWRLFYTDRIKGNVSYVLLVMIL